MRGLILAALAGAGAVLLSGCAPSLQASNEVGGIVKEGVGPNKGSHALAEADAHCRRYGKAARVSGENVVNNTLTFDCVSP